MRVLFFERNQSVQEYEWIYEVKWYRRLQARGAIRVAVVDDHVL